MRFILTSSGLTAVMLGLAAAAFASAGGSVSVVSEWESQNVRGAACTYAGTPQASSSASKCDACGGTASGTRISGVTGEEVVSKVVSISCGSLSTPCSQSDIQNCGS